MTGKRAAACTTENKPFAKRLCSLMVECGENQKELAEELGVKQQTISYYRNGQSTPDADNLIKIARHYGVTTDFLLGLTEVSTTDTELKAVCEYTGLSEIAIRNLREMKVNDQTIEKYVPSKWYGDLRILDEIICNKAFLWTICHNLAQMKMMKDTFSALEERNVTLKYSEYKELRELVEEKTEGMAYIVPYAETIRGSYASVLNEFIMLVEKLTNYSGTISKYDNLWCETYEKLFDNERGDSNA